jgi:hypothetical protein
VQRRAAGVTAVPRPDRLQAEANIPQDPAGPWSALFETDDLSSRVALLREPVKSVADKDPSALQVLLEMPPAVDALLADVQAALGQGN